MFKNINKGFHDRVLKIVSQLLLIICTLTLWLHVRAVLRKVVLDSNGFENI